MEYNYIDSIISEAALRVNDRAFNEIDKSIYVVMYYRVLRELIRKYRLMTRIYEFKDDGEGDNIVLNIKSFMTENRVYINKEEYTKVDEFIDNNKKEYSLKLLDNRLLFDYSNRKKDNQVVIFYDADVNVEDFDLEEIKPVLPTYYNEELIRLLIIEICKIGMGKYINTVTGEKYGTLYRVYYKIPSEIDRHLVKNKEWIVIKPYKPY